jgi:cellulose synthase/poly-beta-1,6-N-acetylglucosamine synthase-like glycosyltransferase
MSTPYVYRRNRRWYRSLLHICYYNYCHSHRSKSLQLTSYTSRS